MSIFINGVPQKSAPNKPAFNGDNTNLFIGRWASSGTNTARLLDGQIEDLRIYSVGLSDASVQSLYNSSSFDF